MEGSVHFSNEVISSVGVALRNEFKACMCDFNESDIAYALTCITKRSKQHKYWRQVICGRYSNEVKSYKTIGLEIGLSAQRVRQVLDKYLRVIRGEIELNMDSSQEGKFPLERTINALNLPVRTRNILLNNGIRTIGDLIALSRTELLEIYTLGPVAIHDIELGLSKFGLVVGIGIERASAVVSNGI